MMNKYFNQIGTESNDKNNKYIYNSNNKFE